MSMRFGGLGRVPMGSGGSGRRSIARTRTTATRAIATTATIATIATTATTRTRTRRTTRRTRTTTTTTTAVWRAIAVLGGLLGRGVEAVTTVPAPISVEASQYWEGSDGPWSSFPIRVGTPEQAVRVFPSTAATSTWVVGSLGCSAEGMPANCTTTRGGTFNFSTSSTWQENGPFYLQIEDTLGGGYPQDRGDFGWETVGLGFLGSGGPTLNHTVTAWLATADFWIGQLGLNPRPTNFTADMSDPQTSYLSLLYQQGEIPSLSYGYTAGARYRFNGVLGSLTLGGKDAGLFVDTGVSFAFFFDQTRDLTVGLQAITATNVTSATTATSLLPTAILALIDTTVPQIWLPVEACAIFEQAFGLTYDNATDLYLVSDAQHRTLLAQNTTLTFTLGQTVSSTATVSISLPYAAFDLELTYPIVAAPQRYFPLRRAANATQYTLGRTFLQESYLTVDYHRGNFSVSPRVWAESPANHIVAVFPPAAANSTGSGTSTSTGAPTAAPAGPSTLAPGAIAGIAIGAVALLAGAFLAGWFFFRLKRRRSDEKRSLEVAAQLASEPKPPLPDPYASPATTAELTGGASAFNELMGDAYGPDGQYKYRPVVGSELHGQHFFTGAEVDGTPGSERRFELGSPEGVEGRVELEAPHGTQELSGARPVEIEPPPAFGGAGVGGGGEIGGVDVPSRSRSDGEKKEGRVRPFSWQQD